MNSLANAKKRLKAEKGNAKKSKLDNHTEAIEFLLKNDYTLLQIQNFLLEDCDCKVAYSTLQGFAKRRFKENNSEINSNKIELEKIQNTKVETPKKIEKKDIKTSEKKITKNNKLKGKSAIDILHSDINIHDFLDED